MTKLQTVISSSNFCMLNADENCQIRWQKMQRNQKGSPLELPPFFRTWILNFKFYFISYLNLWT